MSALQDFIDDVPSAAEGFASIDDTVGGFTDTVYVLQEALTGCAPEVIEAAQGIVPAVEALRRRVKTFDAALGRLLKICEVQP
jgi:hypothetical protein